ncbi:MAG: RidA family protein [Myxococcales bacterium]|nr:RidA family protein [Myxococcales bacterium]
MSERRAIESRQAPQAIGPYSQAVLRGRTLYLSGQIPLDPASGALVGGSIAEQTHRVMQNLAGVLEAAGASFSDVVMTTIYLTDLADFAAVNAVYASYLRPPYPARATVQVAALPKGVPVEISMIAMLE